MNGIQVEKTSSKVHPPRTKVSVIGDDIYGGSSGGSDVKIIKAYGQMDLQRKMNKLISKGYVPQGNPVINSNNKIGFGGLMPHFTQVMRKD